MTTKIAISLPDEVFRALARHAKQAQLSRSAAVALAIRAWTRESLHRRAIAQYVEAYRAHPESDHETWPTERDAWHPYEEPDL